MENKSNTVRLGVFVLALLLLVSCQAKSKEQVNLNPQKELPTAIVQVVQHKADEPLMESDLINPSCQLGLSIPWEHDENNPIREEAKILEILKALSDFETCNFTRKEGWLYRYDLLNDERGKLAEFLGHFTGTPGVCDLQLAFEDKNGNLIPIGLYDNRGGKESQPCDSVYTGALGIGSRGPFFISGLLPGYTRTFELIKEQGDFSGIDIKVWFECANEQELLILEHWIEDMGGVMLATGNSPNENGYPIKSELRRYTIDLTSGRQVGSYSEIYLMDGRILTNAVSHEIAFYEVLPDSLQTVLEAAGAIP